ncbi:MAG: tetratricopeptide repeat protein [Deltaproteobacteria bacterium]|nr:tetratricopeptide repeat protein [Deltaproteobacteria bacterium]
MQWSHKVIIILLVCCIVGGAGAVFDLPGRLTAITSPAQSIAAPASVLPDPSNLSVYAPEVQQLLETTYLGRKKESPDPEEPAVVLQKYLEQNAHGYHSQLVAKSKKLNAELAAWKDLARQYPQSRHALVALAKHYRTKAQVSGDTNDLRQAADAYLKAADIGLAYGRILYTRQLSEILIDLGDKKRLDEIFGRMLAQPKDSDRDAYYLALVDYADGLARLDDERAWDHFEEAIAFHPENNLEAINRYARHLLEAGYAQRALAVLDTHLTSQQRVRFVIPAQLRKRTLQLLGMETASADAELEQIEQRLAGAWSVAPTTSLGSAVTSTDPSEARTEVNVASVTADSRISTLFALLQDDPNTPKSPDRSLLQWSAIFSGTGTSNNRWPNMAPGVAALNLATFKWPNGNAGVARLRPNLNLAVRIFTGSTGDWADWTGLQSLPSGYALDVAAVAYPNGNGHADVFAVTSDSCNIYSRHSTDYGATWASWQWWGSCGDQLTVALRPDGTGFAAMRATGANGNRAVVRANNGSMWDNRPIPWDFVGGSLAVSDLALTAYANPVNNVRMRLWAVGKDDCRLYASDWNPNNPPNQQWTNFTLQSSSLCLKSISSFSTSDGGAYLLLIDANDKLSTQRFTGSAWQSPVQQSTGRTWIAAAGVNIDNDKLGNSYEHVESFDDCRKQSYTNGPICDNYGNCFWTQGVNLAEIIYNEARGETRGAQDTVGWTVRDRAFQSLSCDAYPGGNTVCPTPCNQVEFCGPPNNTQRYCCAMHGGQTQWGTSGYQFNDEHVDINELSIGSLIIWEAADVGNGWVPDPSTGWCPPGVIGCSSACQEPGSQDGDNFNDPSPSGPMEFVGYAYDPKKPACKQAPTADTCSSAADNFVCCNASPNNYFWNRKP